jgi:CubicO group peptidase (beta-lactamase class C family)
MLKNSGMSAAVVQDQELIWASGFGYVDVENQIAAGPDTPYGLASVTKPVAAVLIMQLVE